MHMCVYGSHAPFTSESLPHTSFGLVTQCDVKETAVEPTSRERPPKIPRFSGPYGRWSLTRVEPEGSLSRTGLTHLIRREFIA